MSTITLFSKPNCPACKSTELLLNRYKLEFNKIDITTDPDSAEQIKKLGYQSLPVVYCGKDFHWSGLNLGNIRKIAVAQ